MKILKLFFVLILSIAFFSCNKEENRQIKVDKYVKLLKANKYNNAQLPAFTLEDIDELLEYRNEKDMIINFPRNNISSTFHEEVELGIYILWTIEAIRQSSITGLKGIFPSLEPAFVPRGAESYDAEKQQAAQQEASNAYYTWWTMRYFTSATFGAWLNMDPMEDTNYKWH